MIALIRLAILLLTRRWGLIVVGVVLVLVGLIMGASSHRVSYRTVNQGTIIHYLYGQTDSGGDANNDAYIQLQDGSLYFLNESDFTPTLNSDTIQSQSVTLIYDPSDTKSIDANSSNTSTHLSGTGDGVVQLTSFDNSGQNPKVFTTSEYTQHPNGFYSNNWPTGIALLLLGLLISGAALVLPRFIGKKNQAGFSMTPPAGGVPPMGPVPNSYAPPNAYQRPYTNPTQYAPQGGYTQYPGATPYGQPPQAPQAPAYPAQSPQAPQAPAYPPAPGSYGATQYGSPYDGPPQAY